MEEFLSVWFVFYLVVGLLVGFLSGLVGMGGGAVIVPAMTWALTTRGYSTEHVLHVALGTSMAAIAVVCYLSARAHAAHGAVDWGIVRRMTPGLIAGAFFGTWLARIIPTFPLALFYAFMICYAATNMLVQWKPPVAGRMLGWFGMFIAGFVICTLAALAAVGGAAMTIPFLAWTGVAFHTAIGTAAGVSVPLAIASAIGYIVNGLDQTGLPPMSLGYVHLPAFVGIALGSSLLSPLGARIAHRTSAIALRRIFAVLMYTIAIKLAWSLA